MRCIQYFGVKMVDGPSPHFREVSESVAIHQVRATDHSQKAWRRTEVYDAGERSKVGLSAAVGGSDQADRLCSGERGRELNTG